MKNMLAKFKSLLRSVHSIKIYKNVNNLCREKNRDTLTMSKREIIGEENEERSKR